AAAVVTVIALRFGTAGAVIAGTVILAVVMLVLAEIAPKTIAALNPPRIALPAALIYHPLLKVAYPAVWLINAAASGVLRLLGVRPGKAGPSVLNGDELRTVVAEAGVMVPRRHQRVL